MPGLALLVTVMALRAGAQGPVAEARKMFEEGNALFEKAENDKALASYDRALALDRTQAEFHLARCRTPARLERHGRAREYFEKAVAPPAQQSAFGAVAAYYELQRMKK
jgi:tetratricopeptide (TPR) repeat protein